jgi:hypothetical protein
MKIKRLTKELNFGEFNCVIKKLSTDDFLDIQHEAVKITKMDDKATNENILNYTEIDNKLFRKLRVLKSIIKWNIEDETAELAITLENIGLLDTDIFMFLEKEINAFNGINANQIKN